MDPRRLLHIFGRGSRRLGLIAAPEQRAAAVETYYWNGTNICFIYLVGVHVRLVYLGPDQRKSRTLIPPIRVPERI